MSKPPLPEAAVTMLAKPNPSVIATLRPDGQPVTAATWYLWDDGRVLVNMDEGRKRLEHMRNNPRVSLTVLAPMTTGTPPSPSSGTSASWREDTDLADIDRVCLANTSASHTRSGTGRGSVPGSSVDRWYGWGSLKDSSQPG